jgi:hypothetical protein
MSITNQFAHATKASRAMVTTVALCPILAKLTTAIVMVIPIIELK